MSGVANCAECRFWQVVPSVLRRDGARVGNCRRRAPVLHHADDGRHHSQFPRTPESGLCGEGEPVGEAKA